jgi:DNA replication protein DnaC
MNPILLDRVHLNLKKLELFHFNDVMEETLSACLTQERSHLEVLDELLEAEVAFRQERAIKMRLQLANLPAIKTLDSFEMNFHADLNPVRIRDLFTLQFIHRNQNIIFLGPPGVGKSHLAIALAVASCQGGFMAYFTTFQDLINTLKKADQIQRLKSKIKALSKPKVLVIDEMGYLPLTLEESNYFFQLIVSRYEKGSLILTSNKSYGNWSEIFPDTTIATAILDRLLHHSITINIKGFSYRLKDKKPGLFDTFNPEQKKGGKN